MRRKEKPKTTCGEVEEDRSRRRSRRRLHRGRQEGRRRRGWGGMPCSDLCRGGKGKEIVVSMSKDLAALLVTCAEGERGRRL